ncbi:hypothetical protein ACQ86N_07555 [Puia sp. P3]|uniref:hypothetical protein n=1 Tax=Puia sp. P3 TaxID=3423952 RepID=UPI003D6655B5
MEHLLANWEKRFTEWIESNGDHSDGSHDLGHFQRVWKAARYINREEGGRLTSWFCWPRPIFMIWYRCPRIIRSVVWPR